MKDSEKKRHPYEFGGPLGAFGISFGLPIVCYASAFLCNDISGCPAPSLLNLSTFSLEKLKRETGWPGFQGLVNLEANLWLFGYYLLQAVLQGFLPGKTVEGVVLNSGGRLSYKLNSFYSSTLILALAASGTVLQGANFPLWTFIYDHYIHLLTANILIAYALATFVYVRSFNVKSGNKDKRELAAGGHTGNILYDWFIGRELNPRVNLPLIGMIDIKIFCELRPGITGWLLLDLAFMANQYKRYGTITDSMICVNLFHALYAFDTYWMESSILTTIDITTDGFGFMLALGDLVWVPFIYSTQARYLAVHPVSLGPVFTSVIVALQIFGFYLFRASNNEKNRFRTDPKDPRISHLKYMETKSGSKLLISGWWGVARHVNYLGDWIMAWSYCLPTGIAGYSIMHSAASSVSEVVQGGAKGWGMFITYFYLVYFSVLLLHREMRDEEKCSRKYGADWAEYKKKVPYRIIPGIY
ncbi:MAG: erg24, C-14 sterol reductase [Trizodia sp. TS-e1964]|nr:MAG: erg24, C-14 sterol reductase [Trizodia sp. TS-e1964]